VRDPVATAIPDRAGRRSWRIAAFALVCILCGLGALVAVDRGGTATGGGGPVEIDADLLADLQAGPHAVFVDTRVGPGYGHAALVDTSRPDQVADTDMACDRVDMVGDRGICLRADRGVLTTYQAVVFDDQFQTVATYDLPGIPSRTRVSPDGSMGAWTTFVSGDSYLATGLSTRTHLVNLRTGEEAGDLEKFTVIRDGKVFSEVDFNFWGVTFADDPNVFYATLSSGGRQYLVEGDIARREVVVLRDGIECPSLSPDGTRVAYKKRVTGDLGRIEWRLSVLDLETMVDHELAETRGIDDQVQWLDDDTVIYGISREEAGTPTKDTYAVPADGSGAPQLLVSGAWSLGQTVR
jgi:hypothetical protein